MKKEFYLLTIILSLSCFNTQAQLKEQAEAETDSLLRPSAFIPFDLVGKIPLYSNVKLSTDFKNNNASGDFVFNFRKNDEHDHFFALQFQQSVSEDTEEFTPFDLSGLTKGTTVKFGYRYHYWNPELTDTEFQKFDEVRNDYARSKGVSDSRSINYSQLDNKSKRQLVGLLKPHYFFSFNYSINNKEMDYIADVTNPESVSEFKLNQQFSTTVGSLFGRRRNQSVFLSHNLISSYSNAGDPIDIIVPINTTGAYYLKEDVVIGKPKFGLKNLIQMTYRIMIYNEQNTPLIGLAPNIEYVIENGQAAFQLPIYFIPGINNKGEPKGLTGGLRFGYSKNLKNTDESSSFSDALRIGLVLAVPFSDIGNF